MFIVGAEGQLVLGLLVFGDVVYGYERSARYFVFVLDRQIKGCIISFVVWRSAVCLRFIFSGSRLLQGFSRDFERSTLTNLQASHKGKRKY